MYSVRRWVIRHSRVFEFIYNVFEPVIALLDPLWRGIDYARVERPIGQWR